MLLGGVYWFFWMWCGIVLCFIDVEGGVNVGMLFYNLEEKLECYNVLDSFKGQYIFKFICGNCLYLDMGWVFVFIVEDSFGWYDIVCGNLYLEQVKEKYGEYCYQDYYNDWYLSGYISFFIELVKYGFIEWDLVVNFNLFSKVVIDDEGILFFDFLVVKVGV